MITPAKWQAKGGPKNEAFRRDIVPYMSKIVFYPCAQEIFDIVEADGICYYLIDKNEYIKKLLKVQCKKQYLMETDFYETELVALVNNKIESIIIKCNDNKYFNKKLDFDSSKYLSAKNQDKICTDGNIEVFGGTNGIKFTSLGFVKNEDVRTLDGIDKYKTYVSSMVGDSTVVRNDGKAIGLIKAKVLNPFQICKSNFCCLMTFDTYSEANSLVSYLDTKLVRFLISCSCVGAGLTMEFFRFVPDPGKFDHIFTDQELYKKYNLTDEEINIIESVIKERK